MESELHGIMEQEIMRGKYLQLREAFIQLAQANHKSMLIFGNVTKHVGESYKNCPDKVCEIVRDILDKTRI